MSKLKLMIADDEKWICALIQEMIDFDAFNLELIGVAYDGPTTLSLIRQDKPDIVITDIKMPGCDGLDVIREVRAEGMNTHFIIISGYSTFEYAKTALKYRVDEYLLKPINRKALSDSLAHICTEIRKSNADDLFIANIQNRLEYTTAKIRAQFVLNVMFSPEVISRHCVSEINSEYNYRFISGSFAVLLLKAIPLSEEIQIDNTLAKIDSLLKTKLSKSCNEYEGIILKNQLVIIINYSDPLKSIINSVLDYSFKSVINTDFVSTLLNCTLYKGNAVNSIQELNASYNSAKSIVNMGLLFGTGTVYSAADTCPGNPGEPFRLSEDQRSVLLKAVTHREDASVPGACLSLLNDYLPYLKQHPSDLDVFFSNCFEIVNDYIEKNQIMIERFDLFRDEFFDQLSSLPDYRSLVASFSNVMAKISNDIAEQTTDSHNIIILKAQNYILHHLADKITVEDVSSHVFLSPNYFSSLFKKETGMSFVDYVSKVKIEKAKEYLTNPNYSISDVGEMVGFKDPQYFSRTFKKIVGINPQSFRKISIVNSDVF